MNTKFVPGLELNRSFYHEVIQPLLAAKYPELKYSAALLGYGSDVLGVDTAISMDHNWGPRCLLFVDKKDLTLKDELTEYFSQHLPFSFHDFPTNYSDPRYDQTQSMKETQVYPVNHFIEIFEIEDYFQDQLSIKDINNISIKDWLAFKEQVLIELISGEVFYDGLDKLNAIRNTLKFYPQDILKLRLASLWDSIWCEEPFIGRSIELDDFIGLKTIASRIISLLIKIAFYVDNKYIPYSKWFGTSFKQLSSYDFLVQSVLQALQENQASLIEDRLCELYTKIIDLHNGTHDLPLLDNKVQNFFNRPYKVIFAESIVQKLLDSIQNKEIKNTPLHHVALDIKLDSIDFT